MSNVVLDKARVEILMGHYGTAPASALADQGVLPRVQEYRRMASARIQLLDRDAITHKVPAGEFHVSRKVDGEFTVLVYREGVAFSVNPGGAVRVGQPWLEEAAKLLGKAGVRDAMTAGELAKSRKKGGARQDDFVSAAATPLRSVVEASAEPVKKARKKKTS